MKSIFLSLALLTSGSAHANVNALDRSLDALSGPDCLQQLKAAVYDFTHPAAWAYVVAPTTTYVFKQAAKATVLSNLKNYKQGVETIIANLSAGRSSEHIYQNIRNSIEKQKTEGGLSFDFTGYSKKFAFQTATCVERHLNFAGTAAQQYALAQKARTIIVDIENEVRK